MEIKHNIKETNDYDEPDMFELSVVIKGSLKECQTISNQLGLTQPAV